MALTIEDIDESKRNFLFLNKEIKNVKYIAFEGGGGKGIAYLGAAFALEHEKFGKILPIRDNGILDRSPIKGVSGSSAGAINALLTAIGMSYKEVLDFTTNGFDIFFERPKPGIYRGIKLDGIKNVPCFAIDAVNKSLDGITETPNANFKDSDFIATAFYLVKTESEAKSKARIIKNFHLKLVPKILTATIATILYPYFQAKFLFSNKPTEAAMKAVLKNPLQFSDYVYNLIQDRGVFPGFEARIALQKVINDFLKPKYDLDATVLDNSPEFINHPFNAETLTFKQFFKITKVELIITVTNLTTNSPVVFSQKLTPDFPVAEAVGASMSIPGFFKPVYNDGQVDTSKSKDYNVKYKGLLADGGAINNIPIHVFDNFDDRQPCQEDNLLYALHPNVLALRLTDGMHPKDVYAEIVKDKDYILYLNKQKNKKILVSKTKGLKAIYAHRTFMSTFFNFLGNVYNSISFYTEDGQFRTEREKKQSVQLYSYDIDIFNFTPETNLKRFVVKRAIIEMREYFKVTDKVENDPLGF